MSRQTLWKIEKGVTASAKGEVLESLAAAFGLSVAQLLGQGPPSGRNELLRRLLLCAESISEEDWLLLEQIAKRVTATNLASTL
jgi:transcriptional regulator with XRE-family HTH domain